MKQTPLKWIICCSVACIMTGTSMARPEHETGSGKSQQFCPTKDLVGADVKGSDGQKIGDISEIYINPQTGATFAAIGMGHSRYAIVPVQALKVTQPGRVLKNAEVTLNKTKADLETAPMLTGNEWQKLDDRSFTQSVYTHYNIQAPSMGSATTPGGVITDTDSSATAKPAKRDSDKSSEPDASKSAEPKR